MCNACSYLTKHPTRAHPITDRGNAVLILCCSIFSDTFQKPSLHSCMLAWKFESSNLCELHKTKLGPVILLHVHMHHIFGLISSIVMLRLDVAVWSLICVRVIPCLSFCSPTCKPCAAACLPRFKPSRHQQHATTARDVPSHAEDQGSDPRCGYDAHCH